MNLILVSAYFPPEVGSASHLYYELGTELVKRGHHVAILTGYPAYNIDQKALPVEYRSGWWMKERVNGMEVIRIRTIGMPRQIPVLRGLGQITLSLVLSFSGLFLTKGAFDVVLVYSPPLFLGWTAFILRRLKGMKAVLNVQDLFPQSAIDLGVLRSKFLINWFRRIESNLYRNSDLVVVHSPGNRDHVVSCGGSVSKVMVIPNMIDTKSIKPGERNNEFRRRHGISTDEYIVSFAGVIGLSQDIDTVIDAAKQMEHEQKILFYIVGDGLEKPRLMARAKGMSNVRFLPMLRKDEYVELLQASDICLATLRKEVRTPVVPSKIMSIMAAGRPLIAGLPLHGDAPKIIEAARCGICIEPENPPALAEAVRRIYQNPGLAQEYREHGRKFVEQHYSLEVCSTLYELAFKNLTEQRRGQEK
ncbi:MAG: glycosyltransferase family 4 protein [Bacteroidota bacterium]|jgi:glycosyltransferase involved in cell wall biosynthesis